MQMNTGGVGIINVYENHSPSDHSVIPLISIHPETMFLRVILRSPAKSGTTKNLIVSVAAKILRGVYLFDRTCRRGVRLRLTRSPQVMSLRAGSELAEGLRMTLGSPHALGATTKTAVFELKTALLPPFPAAFII